MTASSFFRLVVFLLHLAPFTCLGQNVTEQFELYYHEHIPAGNTFNAKRVTGQKWNIRFHFSAGCIASLETSDSLSRLNLRMEEQISAKFGPKWKEAFERDFQEEFERENKVSTLLNSSSIIREKQRELSLEYGMSYRMDPIPNTSSYTVFAEVCKNGEWTSFCELVVDYTTHDINITPDQSSKPKE
jgi:hypothetical protein